MMTREEAIAFGKRVINLGFKDETQAFCELAIKALEQNDGLENMVKMGIVKDCESCKAHRVGVLEKIEAEIYEVYEDLDGYDPDSLGTLACRIGEIIDKYKRE